MTLAILQTVFQQSVLGGTQDVLADILPSRWLDSAARLAIYQHAYRARLAEFLSHDYPVLRDILGDDAFGEIVAAYIDATPSLHRNARWYGAALPEFLRSQEPWSAARVLGDLASFERALAEAFDAQDDPGLDAAALADVEPEGQPRLRFIFSASLRLLRLAQGIVAAYEAALEDAEVPPPDSDVEETVLIWRDATLESVYRRLDADEALALNAARNGARLEEICALLALRHSPETAAAEAGLCIARWFADGLVSGLSCD